MKKILLLGGSAQQVIAIETAKKLGYYTVLCDYLPDNPGQFVADRFYLESTTDKETILEIAKKENVNGILAYASDPAAPTAAYVAEMMELPGNPYHSVQILCDKGRYREFLKEHDFCTPKAIRYNSLKKALEDCGNGKFKLPVIVKPTDSSGSKGVVYIDNLSIAKEKLEYAFAHSRVKEIIIEEYVKKQGYQIAGDGLSVDGKLVFRCFGDDHFDESGSYPFVPVAASFPSTFSNAIQDKVHEEIQRLITLLRMNTCTYNFDIRVDEKSNIYLMEVAPRDGGNYIPQTIQHVTGVDLVECSIKAAMGEPVSFNKNINLNGFWSYYAVHSKREGILDCIKIKQKVVKDYIVENHIIKKPGDTIFEFVGADATLGCLIMKFQSMDEMLEMMDHSERWIDVSISGWN